MKEKNYKEEDHYKKKTWYSGCFQKFFQFDSELKTLTSEQLVKQEGRHGGGESSLTLTRKRKVSPFNQSLHKFSESLTSHLLHT